jgi:hypothetical protein
MTEYIVFISSSSPVVTNVVDVANYILNSDRERQDYRDNPSESHVYYKAAQIVGYDLEDLDND